MAKFRVMIVKKNGKPVGVRAAAINGRTIVLALRDMPEQMNWHDAVKLGIPSKEDWMAIAENLETVNKALSLLFQPTCSSYPGGLCSQISVSGKRLSCCMSKSSGALPTNC